MPEVTGFGAQKFDKKPTPYVETGIGVYATCDEPVTELNQIGITLSQVHGKSRKWLVTHLDKKNAIALAELLLKKANEIADDAPEPDLRSYSWNLVTGKPNY